MVENPYKSPASDTDSPSPTPKKKERPPRYWLLLLLLVLPLVDLAGMLVAMHGRVVAIFIGCVFILLLCWWMLRSRA